MLASISARKRMRVLYRFTSHAPPFTKDELLDRGLEALISAIDYAS